jgi:riboflavin synthase
MFTGIIEYLGKVTKFTHKEGLRIGISINITRDTKIGESVAVNGVCLTVVEKRDDEFTFDVVEETLKRTNLGKLKVGDLVNIELPVSAEGLLGGHIVQGHIDGIGKITGLGKIGKGTIMDIKLPEELINLMVEKGSVAVDGISLTIASIKDNTISIALIPHTLEKTTLGKKKIGDTVNIEADIIAKYVKNFVSKEITSKVTPDFLKQAGF